MCNKFCDNFCIYSNVSFIIRVNEGTNKRDEPKGIVFLSQLLLLFQHCHHCFHPNPKVKTSCSGTLLIIESQCSNCKESFTWKSQPYLFGKFPAGNILLSFAILCAGASVKKVRKYVAMYHLNHRYSVLHKPMALYRYFKCSRTWG